MTGWFWPTAVVRQGRERRAGLLCIPAGRIFCGMMAAGDPLRPFAPEAISGQKLPLRIARAPLCYTHQIEQKEKSGHAL